MKETGRAKTKYAVRMTPVQREREREWMGTGLGKGRDNGWGMGGVKGDKAYNVFIIV